MVSEIVSEVLFQLSKSSIYLDTPLPSPLGHQVPEDFYTGKKPMKPPKMDESTKYGYSDAQQRGVHLCPGLPEGGGCHGRYIALGSLPRGETVHPVRHQSDRRPRPLCRDYLSP